MLLLPRGQSARQLTCPLPPNMEPQSLGIYIATVHLGTVEFDCTVTAAGWYRGRVVQQPAAHLSRPTYLQPAARCLSLSHAQH